MKLDMQVRSLEALAADLLKATSVKDKIHLADRIFETLSECEKMVERFIVINMANGDTSTSKPAAQSVPALHAPAAHIEVSEKQFKGMALADIGKVLLAGEGRVLHGKEIERLAKAGGLKSNSENFQSYLAVAFKRAGGFENVGKNNWRLNDAIPPETRPVIKQQ